MQTWYQVAVLSVGGVLGVNARFWLGVAISRYTSSQFPWATFTINITGSFAIGLCTAVLARWLPHPHARLLVIVGFLGGYTTFSSYSMESLALWERGERSLCLAYVIGSVVAGLVAVVLGTVLGRGLPQPDAARAVSDSHATKAYSQLFPSRPSDPLDPSDLVDVPRSLGPPPAPDRRGRIFVKTVGDPRNLFLSHCPGLTRLGCRAGSNQRSVRTSMQRPGQFLALHREPVLCSQPVE